MVLRRVDSQGYAPDQPDIIRGAATRLGPAAHPPCEDSPGQPYLGARARHDKCHQLCSSYPLTAEDLQVGRGNLGARSTCNSQQMPPGDYSGLALPQSLCPPAHSVREAWTHCPGEREPSGSAQHTWHLLEVQLAKTSHLTPWRRGHGRIRGLLQATWSACGGAGTQILPPALVSSCTQWMEQAQNLVNPPQAQELEGL